MFAREGKRYLPLVARQQMREGVEAEERAIERLVVCERKARGGAGERANAPRDTLRQARAAQVRPRPHGRGRLDPGYVVARERQRRLDASRAAADLQQPRRPLMRAGDEREVALQVVGVRVVLDVIPFGNRAIGIVAWAGHCSRTSASPPAPAWRRVAASVSRTRASRRAGAYADCGARQQNARYLCVAGASGCCLASRALQRRFG